MSADDMLPPAVASTLIPLHHAHTLKRAILILRDLCSRAATSEDPYAGLSYGEDSDDLQALLNLLLGNGVAQGVGTDEINLHLLLDDASEVVRLRNEQLVMADLMGQLLDVVLTIEADDTNEAEDLSALIQRTRNALSAVRSRPLPKPPATRARGASFPQPTQPTGDLMQSDTITETPTIGQPYEGGFYGGEILSHGGTKRMAVIWAPKAQGETTGAWLPKLKAVPGATSCWHSMDNTRAMAEAGSAIAQWALAQQINGHQDWCIPSRDVLELGYRHLKPTTRKNWASFRDGDNPSSVPAGYPYTESLPAQTDVEAFREGGAEAFDEACYWSSTQYSESLAWLQDFGYGYQLTYAKKFEGRVRLVRLIHLNP